MVERFALGERPVDELDGAVDRRALFVAGDEEADRACERRPGDEAQGGGDGGGDAPLHVAGAAAPEATVGDFARERVEPPERLIARRHDVGVAGEGEIGLGRAEPRIKVENRRRSRRLEGDKLGRETGLAQKIAQVGQRAAVGRRHRRKADEARARFRAPMAERTCSRLRPRPTSAAFRAPARPSRGRRRRSAARCWREDSTNPSAGCASRT